MSSERVILLPDWPQPDAGAPTPVTIANESALFVRYDTSEGKVAVIHFPLCAIFTFGSPNDESLAGHPLFGRGLTFYSVHRVENSAWIAQLERRNAVHSRHDRRRFLEDKVHYVFTFHDSTLECVVNEGKDSPTEILRFENSVEASAHIRAKMSV